MKEGHYSPLAPPPQNPGGHPLAEQRIYIPVVAMSANRDSLMAATAAGARDTLSKPFDLLALLAAIQGLYTDHS
jgi:CheY-like chemotaxis protein